MSTFFKGINIVNSEMAFFSILIYFDFQKMIKLQVLTLLIVAKITSWLESAKQSTNLTIMIKLSLTDNCIFTNGTYNRKLALIFPKYLRGMGAHAIFQNPS